MTVTKTDSNLLTFITIRVSWTSNSGQKVVRDLKFRVDGREGRGVWHADRWTMPWESIHAPFRTKG